MGRVGLCGGGSAFAVFDEDLPRPVLEMLRPCKYLFYRLYTWQLRLWGEAELPQFNALFFVSILATLNVYSLFDVIGFLLGINVLKVCGIGKIHAIAIYVAMVGLGYFILVKDERYQKIAKLFKDESLAKRRRNLFLCILYVAGTFVMAFSWPV